ncbi:DUF952 domain-containing protein [Bacillus sp. DX4.1]|uniref:DUF952 domain-containing protein n=1 Tax=Bacillus sp. DX4.1 TaxID=3055867 RepID=UPI0025A1138D|nr:DUF952 domain-containing protein [Bacillus sp. DX4.1]MDM5188664.1 DUF952 domain-containing protein [Bacillus sp. DX4.1]
MITKVMNQKDWEKGKQTGEIIEDSLREEGFIHCSSLEQSTEVAKKYFSNEAEVVLLVIEPDLVKAEIKYEVASNGQKYPHIYGVLNVDAVVNVIAFRKENGAFVLPATLDYK